MIPQASVTAVEPALGPGPDSDAGGGTVLVDDNATDVLSKLPVAVLRTDSKARCVFVNEAWVAMSGRSAAASLGDAWIESVHPDDHERVRAAWVEGITGGEGFRVEFRLQRPDDDALWVYAQAACTADEGVCSGHVVALTDVTEQKELQRRKDEVIGVVSHEIRAPMVSIAGALEYMEPHAGRLRKKGRELYKMAVRNARFLNRLVNDLLDIERIEAGSPFDLEPVPATLLLLDLRDAASALGEDAGVEVETRAADAGLEVVADRDRLLQVTLNLVANAIRFSPQGSAVVVVAEDRGDQVRFSVQDRGPGIPASELERIFERFAQVDAGGQGHHGAGLGLPIAQSILQRHGSELRVTSREGEGSTFSFLLPKPD